MTDIYGILAHPTGHSLSPVLYRSAFYALGLPASFELFDVPAEGLADFMKESSLRKGFAVSLPHKENIIPFLDWLEPEAEAIGAVNTVRCKEGRLLGYNTDAHGVLSALRETTEVSGKKVVVLGAGGAARATIYALKKAGASVIVINRTLSRADDLAHEFGVQCRPLDEIDHVIPDILIHATPCGMFPNTYESFLPRSYFETLPVQTVVFDMVYRPRLTPFLAFAKETGHKVISGDRMLLYQAILQFKILTGKEAPADIMEKALLTSLVII